MVSTSETNAPPTGDGTTPSSPQNSTSPSTTSQSNCPVNSRTTLNNPGAAPQGEKAHRPQIHLPNPTVCPTPSPEHGSRPAVPTHLRPWAHLLLPAQGLPRANLVPHPHTHHPKVTTRAGSRCGCAGRAGNPRPESTPGRPPTAPRPRAALCPGAPRPTARPRWGPDALTRAGVLSLLAEFGRTIAAPRGGGTPFLCLRPLHPHPAHDVLRNALRPRHTTSGQRGSV